MRYREFITKNGISVLAGKDAAQNEKLVKEYMGKSNIIMHTSKPGSPFCVISEKPKKGDKKEAAILCAIKSQDWRDNKSDVVVHVFTGKDVYKERGMKLGTFALKKKKNIKIKKSEIETWQQ